MFGNLFDLLSFTGDVTDTPLDVVSSSDLATTSDLFDRVHDDDIVFPNVDNPLNYRSIINDSNRFTNEFDGIGGITGSSDIDANTYEPLMDSDAFLGDTSDDLLDEVSGQVDIYNSDFVHDFGTDFHNVGESLGSMDDTESLIESNSSNVSFGNRYDENTETFVKKMEEYGVEIPRSVDRTYNDSHKVTMDRHCQGGMTEIDKHLCRSSINKAFENN